MGCEGLEGLREPLDSILRFLRFLLSVVSNAARRVPFVICGTRHVPPTSAGQFTAVANRRQEGFATAPHNGIRWYLAASGPVRRQDLGFLLPGENPQPI
jgi:hypothetical protein